ncbi:glypican-6 [Lingula anatina]|uniref:Glypican-6 n=1 Tax=Lingula anatina TaxID=7574 RepID=A0A1S3JNC2_LINAN|nr:glypican-6 [Lingula anatina]|eukprot:XP_013411641.1 glypican-6 [Lingula anatina]
MPTQATSWTGIFFPVRYLAVLLLTCVLCEGQTSGRKPNIATVFVKISPPKWEANVTNRCECEGAISQMLGTVGLMMDRLDQQNMNMKRQGELIRELQERLDKMEPSTSVTTGQREEGTGSRGGPACGCGPGLLSFTRHQMMDIYMNITSPYQSSLFTLAEKLKQFVLSRIRMEEREASVLFRRTYGLLYEKMEPAFKRLFNDMYDYIDGKSVDLEGKVNSFFRDLSHRLFRLLHPASLDQRYLDCVGRVHDQQDVISEGFRGADQKLGRGLRKASQATRGLIYGLKSGAKVMSDLSTLPLTAECMQAATQLQFCPRCDVRPCQGFCVNVMKGCYAQHWELTRTWRTYIDALAMLETRVQSVFNIDVILNTVAIHISDAILTYQENSENITAKVTAACGPLPSFLRRRQKRAMGDATSYEFRRDMMTQDEFESILQSARRAQAGAENLWQQLHSRICDQLAAPFTEKEKCWNGTHVSRYLPNEVVGGLIYQRSNPEVVVNERTTNAMVSQLRLDLVEITDVLMATHKGKNRDGIDVETQSGSGSGVDDEDM